MRRLFWLLLLPLLAVACGDSNASVVTTAPTPAVTESFTGTLTIRGASTFPFAVQTSGAVTATLISIAPDTTSIVGLSLGTWNGSLCQVVLANDQALQGSTVVGN